MTNYKAGSFIFDEISSQGSAWAEIVSISLNQREAIRELFTGIDALAFTGCGSDFNVSDSDLNPDEPHNLSYWIQTPA